MVIENDPSARMQVRTIGELQHPGSCMVCGSGTCADGYLDLGVFFDYEGHMYLCMLCATQGGETVGMYTSEEVEGLKTLADELANENLALKEKLDAAQPLIDMWNNSLASLPEPGSVSDSAASEDSESEQGSSSESVSRSASGESESEESAESPRSSNPSESKRSNFQFS